MQQDFDKPDFADGSGYLSTVRLLHDWLLFIFWSILGDTSFPAPLIKDAVVDLFC